jgi:hypothetical protein
MPYSPVVQARRLYISSTASLYGFTLAQKVPQDGRPMIGRIPADELLGVIQATGDE